MTGSNYRPEIDGLRAISVLGVLLFHFRLGVPGGFVGVDVFFVISGFLITGIIVRQLRAGSFSVAEFWMRRIRRILPAASVMVVVTLVGGFAVLAPLEFEELAESAIAQALVVSNFVFARQDGYFTESADFTPLLHTWSLAVEEQFYLLFPLMLVGLWVRAKRWVPVLMGGIAVLSFVWSCYLVGQAPKSAFFLLPTRAWELLIGGLLAVSGGRSLGKKGSELVALVGLLMVLAAMFVYDKRTVFPGLSAALPVLGAAFFIFGNQGRLTMVGRLLALKPVVFIGLISYSLYLWHWPILVFANLMLIEHGVVLRLCLVVVAVLLGILSWRLVETPFRSGSLLMGRAGAFGFAGTGALVFVAVGWLIVRNDGMVGRFDEREKLLLEDVDWRGEEYEMKDFRGVQIGAVGNGLSGHDFVLWGDSHGMAVAQAVDDSARSAGLRGEAFLLPGVPPVTGLWFGEMEEDERNDLMARNLALVDWMILNRVPNVILVGRWVSFCNGYTEAEVEGREAGYRWTPTVLDEVGQSPGPGVSAAVLTRQLTVMATRLRAAGVEVWLVKQVPETNNLNTARQVSMLKRFPMLNQLDAFTTTRAEHEQRQASTEKAIAEVPLGLLEIIDPEAVFFEGSDQLRIYEERSIYRDDDHLTRFGAQRLMGPVFDELFLKIKEGR